MIATRKFNAQRVMGTQETDSKNFTILIVDDVPANLKLLSQMLIEQGYAVKCVKSGLMALVTLKINKPDLILLDINLPDINGYEICKHLKKNELLRDIPVIFLTVLDDIEDKVKGFRVGGVDYITKPFYIQEVLARVGNQLKISEKQKQLEAKVSNYRDSQEKLQQLALVDSVTGIANRHRFDEHLNREWGRHLLEKSSLSLIMADIDYFKLYNDTYGHIEGDRCLNPIAQTLYMLVKRPGDLVARYGGEEFAIILADTNREQAEAVARRILLAIEHLAIPHISCPLRDLLSLSLGLATIAPVPGAEPNSLVSRADQALYRAKINGRNRYACYD